MKKKHDLRANESKAKQTQFQAPAKMDANLLVEKGL
jgi:hypothetical protein